MMRFAVSAQNLEIRLNALLPLCMLTARVFASHNQVFFALFLFAISGKRGENQVKFTPLWIYKMQRDSVFKMKCKIDTDRKQNESSDAVDVLAYTLCMF